MLPKITDWIVNSGLIIPIGVALFVIYVIYKTVGRNRYIIKNGIPARAKILSVRQTGVMLNDQPQIEFQLQVHPPSGVPYRARAKSIITLINIPQFQPGVEVPVKIHPTDQTKVALVL